MIEGSKYLPSLEQLNANEIITTGSGFCGIEASKEKFFSILSRGLIPGEWAGIVRNTSYDSVCFTVLPSGENAGEIFKSISINNYLVSKLLKSEPSANEKPGSITIGIIADLRTISDLENVNTIKANGNFPQDKYPDSAITNIDQRSLKRARQGAGGGWEGEIRVYFNDSEQKNGITPNVWKGLIIKEEDLATFHEWIRDFKYLNLKIKPLPVFNPQMKYLGTF